MAKATNTKAAAKKSPAKKTAVKTAAKKTASKAAPKKAPAKKTASKTAVKNSPAKKVAAKKVAPKAPPKKAPAKKTASKNVAAKKTASKNVVAKKAAVKMPAKQAPKKAAISDETMLENLFSDSLKDIYYAERSGARALPKLAKAATSPDLRAAFETHAQETSQQVQMLEQVFESMGKKPQGKKCEAIEGLIREADSLIKETKKGSMTRDVALIMAAQKMEHYEIATYGSIASLAKLMGRSEAKDIFGQILQQEKDTDEKLSALAESQINEQAQQEGSEGETANQSADSEDEDLDPEAGKDSDTEE